jgi:hypothetical protein
MILGLGLREAHDDMIRRNKTIGKIAISVDGRIGIIKRYEYNGRGYSAYGICLNKEMTDEEKEKGMRFINPMILADNLEDFERETAKITSKLLEISGQTI